MLTANLDRGDFWRLGSACALTALCTFASPLHAQTVLPAGASMNIAGGRATLGCTDLLLGGSVVVGSGGSVSQVKNAQLASGSTLDVSSASLQLAQQFSNNGNVLAQGGGTVTRVDSAGCPAIGKLGPIDLNVPSNPPQGVTPVPTLQGLALFALALVVGVLGGRMARRRAEDG